VLGSHQDNALKSVADWLKAGPGRNDTPQVFRLFGYAGTGKTTLARHIADDTDGEVKFAAFTGKAASVMRGKGCRGASTIHSLIYRARESGEEIPSFDLWDEAPASKAELIIIDECSMVDAELGRDLLSFGVPVLVLGDPAQLPPIQGGGFFTEAEPDAMLTEVHRQAQDDPIVRLSMDVRAGEYIEPGRYGETNVLRKADLDPQRVLEADQVLVGRKPRAVPITRAASGTVEGDTLGRRQAGLLAQQPQERPVQRRALTVSAAGAKPAS
jgi:exodeoxyribonuclease-5